MFNAYVSAIREFQRNATDLLRQVKANYVWLYREDFRMLETLVANLTFWADAKTAERNATSPTENPVLTARMLEGRFLRIKLQFMKLYEHAKETLNRRLALQFCPQKSPRRVADEWRKCFAEEPEVVPSGMDQEQRPESEPPKKNPDGEQTRPLKMKKPAAARAGVKENRPRSDVGYKLSSSIKNKKKDRKQQGKRRDVKADL